MGLKIPCAHRLAELAYKKKFKVMKVIHKKES